MSQLMYEFILNSLDHIIADRSILCVGISISSIVYLPLSSESSSTGSPLGDNSNKWHFFLKIYLPFTKDVGYIVCMVKKIFLVLDLPSGAGYLWRI